jgi:hypothetical protein
VVSVLLLTVLLGGDAIGVDSSLTDNTGGLSAVQIGSFNYGQPAIGVTLLPGYDVQELRVIVFGELQDDYRYYLWPGTTYLDGLPSQWSYDQAPTSVTPFGNAGPAGNYEATNDLRFDFSWFGPDYSPGLTIYDWVIGFQEIEHNELSPYRTRVTGSNCLCGPIPYFSRQNEPRHQIHIHWGMTLSAFPNGDYNEDGTVNIEDYPAWRDNSGSLEEYTAWQSNFIQNPEPSSLTLLMLLLWLSNTKAVRKYM